MNNVLDDLNSLSQRFANDDYSKAFKRFFRKNEKEYRLVISVINTLITNVKNFEDSGERKDVKDWISEIMKNNNKTVSPQENPSVKIIKEEVAKEPPVNKQQENKIDVNSSLEKLLNDVLSKINDMELKLANKISTLEIVPEEKIKSLISSSVESIFESKIKSMIQSINKNNNQKIEDLSSNLINICNTLGVNQKELLSVNGNLIAKEFLSSNEKLDLIHQKIDGKIDLSDNDQLLDLRRNIEQHIKSSFVNEISKKIIPLVDTLKVGCSQEDIENLKKRCDSAGLIPMDRLY